MEKQADGDGMDMVGPFGRALSRGPLGLVVAMMMTAIVVHWAPGTLALGFEPTVWSGSVVLEEPMVVEAGETLVIEAGTRVAFSDGADLVVHGVIQAIGTAADPITILGELEGGNGGEANGVVYEVMSPSSTVRLDAEGTGSLLAFVRFESMAMVVEGSSPRLEGCTFINNSRMDLMGHCSPVVTGCHFRDNGIGTPDDPWYRPYHLTNGWSMASGPTLVCSYGTTAVVSDCVFEHNGGFGVDVLSASPSVTNCTFSDNRRGGIHLDESFSGFVCTPVITGNTIKGNGDAGALAGKLGPKGRDVPLMFASGVHVDNANARFAGNVIEGNEVGVAVWMNYSGEPEFTGDIISGNAVGVYSYHGSPEFRDCTLDNLVWDFWITSYSHVKAYNTTFDESRTHIEWESKLETEHGILYPVVGGVGIIGLLAAVFVGGTELGKFKFFAFAFPLYTRLRKDQVLDQFTRGQVYGLIRGQPGIHYSEIKRVLRIGNGTLAYHLDVLAKEGFVKSRREGINKLFYPTKLPARFREEVDDRFPQGEEDSRGIRLSELQEGIVSLVKENPGITQASIVERVEAPKQTVSYNLKSLSRYGIIELARDGRRVRCYPVDGIDGQE